MTSFHLLLIPRLHMPAEKRSFLLYPCSQLKPICLDLCLDSEGTLSIGEGGAQRRHEGTRWSSVSKGVLAFFNLVSPLSIVVSVPSLLSPSIHWALFRLSTIYFSFSSFLRCLPLWPQEGALSPGSGRVNPLPEFRT